MTIFKPVRYLSINALILALVVSFNVYHVQAKGPIMTIYDINDQVNQMTDTLDQLNIEDVKIYDARLDGIEELLRTAFLDIGERLNQIQTRLDEIESRQVPPHLARRWISPRLGGSGRDHNRISTIVSILNEGISPAKVNIYLHDDYWGTQSLETYTIPGETENVWNFSNSLDGWIEIISDSPVLVSGHMEFDYVDKTFSMTWYPMPLELPTD